MTNTASIVIYTISAILAIFAIMSFRTSGNKVANMNKKLVIGVALFLSVGLFAWQFGLLSGFSSALTPLSIGGVIVDEDSGDDFVPIAGCNVEDTTVTLSAIDKYTSVPTGGSHRYRVNGGPALVASDAGTLTASPGDNLEILWMNGSTTGYFSEKMSVQIPCAGTKGYSALLEKNGSLSFSVKNSDDNTIDGTLTNQSVGAGDVKTAKLKVTGDYQRNFPYGFDVVVEFNKTTMDDVQLTIGGSDLSQGTAVQSYSATLGVSSSEKTYFLDTVNSNEGITLGVVMDADDSTAPNGLGSDVIVTFYARNYFVDDKNGGAYSGPASEDEYSTATRAGSASQTIHVD